MAPRRNTKTSRNITNLSYKSLKQTDVLCPICRSILIEPVTLPCNHNFCSLCFKRQTANANVMCPSCKVRISSWLRSASKSKKLINERLWEAIQHGFRSQIESKLNKDKKKWNSNTIQEGQNLVKGINDGGKFQLVVKDKHPVSLSNSRGANNFMNKEYTCRILCQNTENETKQTNVENIQMKNKQIQKITQDEIRDRSDSIESEFTCFRPINYRDNPPSEGFQPIKVPSIKPPLNFNAKIVAPSGRNSIIQGGPSAFVRFDNEKKQENTPPPKQPPKKKSKKQTKKRKSRTLSKSPPFKGFLNSPITTSVANTSTPVDSPPFNGFPLPESPPLKGFSEKQSNTKSGVKSLNGEDQKLKQEQSDFQLALKLQDAYDSFGKPTRNRCTKTLETTTTISVK